MRWPNWFGRKKVLRRFSQRAVQELRLEDDNKYVQDFLHREKQVLDEIWPKIEEVEVGLWKGFQGDETTCRFLEERFGIENALRYRGMIRLMILVSIMWFSVYLSVVFSWSTQAVINSYLVLIGILPFAYLLVASPLYFQYTQLLTVLVWLLVGIWFSIRKWATKDFENMLLCLISLVAMTASPLKAKYGTVLIGFLTLLLVVYGFVSIMVFSSYGEDEWLSYGILDILPWASFIGFLYISLIVVAFWNEREKRRTVVKRHIVVSSGSEVEMEAEVSKKLLQSMIPGLILKRLEENTKDVIAEKFDQVTVIFVEVCNFNSITSEYTQNEVVTILNTIYNVLDGLIENSEVYKIETVGPVYMGVAGCPKRSKWHAEEASKLSLKFMEIMPEINQRLKAVVGFRKEVQIRIGLNSGPIVAGILGQHSQRYKLFGDTVNTASRMESTCPPGQIQCSKSTFDLLMQHENEEYFQLLPRGTINVKGKGEMEVFRVTVSSKSADALRIPSASQRTGKTLVNTTNPVCMSNTTGPDRRRSLAVMLKRWSWRDLKRRLSTQVAPEQAGAIAEMAYVHDRSMLSSIFKAVKLGLSCSDQAFRLMQIESGLVHCKFGSAALFWTSAIIFSVLLTVVQVVWGGSRPDDIAQDVWDLFLSGFVVTLVLSTVFFQACSRKILMLAQVVVCVMFLAFITFLSLLNYVGKRPNSSSVMVVSTIFFYINILPLKLRGLVVQVAACGYYGSLYYIIHTYPENYFRYSTFEEEDLNRVNLQDIFGHFLLISATNVVQLLCVATHTSLVFRNYRRDWIISKQKEALKVQKQNSLEIMNRMLPPTIVQRLVRRPSVESCIVDSFEKVTIVFTDMVGFTSFSQNLSPVNLMEFLNCMFSKFDAITKKYDLYKVEVIGDAYFAVSGCPIPYDDHALRAVRVAQEMLETLPELREVAQSLLERENKSHIPANINIRVGIHSGPVLAGVVGFIDPRYHVFGDAVNLANLMESEGLPGKIHASWASLHCLEMQDQLHLLTVEPREMVDLRPLAPVQQTYFVSVKLQIDQQKKNDLKNDNEGNPHNDDDEEEDLLLSLRQFDNVIHEKEDKEDEMK